jgi:hypothetical protein
MAAGIGSRYGGLKQIEPVGPSGEIVIDYSIYDALRAGFDRVVFIIRRDLEEAFRRKLGRTVERRTEVAYVFQELEAVPSGFRVPAGRTKPWGTGHAILLCRESIRTPFWLNADDFTPRGVRGDGRLFARTGRSRRLCLCDGRLQPLQHAFALASRPRGVPDDGRLPRRPGAAAHQRFPDGIHT